MCHISSDSYLQITVLGFSAVFSYLVTIQKYLLTY